MLPVPIRRRYTRAHEGPRLPDCAPHRAGRYGRGTRGGAHRPGWISHAGRAQATRGRPCPARRDGAALLHRGAHPGPARPPEHRPRARRAGGQRRLLHRDGAPARRHPGRARRARRRPHAVAGCAGGGRAGAGRPGLRPRRMRRPRGAARPGPSRRHAAQPVRDRRRPGQAARLRHRQAARAAGGPDHARGDGARHPRAAVARAGRGRERGRVDRPLSARRVDVLGAGRALPAWIRQRAGAAGPHHLRRAAPAGRAAPGPAGSGGCLDRARDDARPGRALRLGGGDARAGGGAAGASRGRRRGSRARGARCARRGPARAGQQPPGAHRPARSPGRRARRGSRPGRRALAGARPRAGRSLAAARGARGDADPDRRRPAADGRRRVARRDAPGLRRRRQTTGPAAGRRARRPPGAAARALADGRRVHGGQSDRRLRTAPHRRLAAVAAGLGRGRAPPLGAGPLPHPGGAGRQVDRVRPRRARGRADRARPDRAPSDRAVGRRDRRRHGLVAGRGAPRGRDHRARRRRRPHRHRQPGRSGRDPPAPARPSPPSPVQLPRRPDRLAAAGPDAVCAQRPARREPPLARPRHRSREPGPPLGRPLHHRRPLGRQPAAVLPRHPSVRHLRGRAGRGAAPAVNR